MNVRRTRQDDDEVFGDGQSDLAAAERQRLMSYGVNIAQRRQAMNRRAFLGTLGFLATPHVAEAQPVGKIPAIGFLSFGFAAAVKPQDEAFRRGMQQLGYVEGENVVVERRYAEGKVDQLRRHVVEFVGRPVDVIVALSSTAALAAKRATTTVPIVFALANDPVGVGLVPNLARPGGNVTGLTPMNAQLNGKRPELFKEAVPAVSRIAVLSMSDYPRLARQEMVREIEVAAERLRVEVHVFEIGSREELVTAFAAMAKRRVGGVTVLPLPLFTTERRRITELALRHRLPSVFQWREYAESGGLMSYGPNSARPHPARRTIRRQDSQGRKTRRSCPSSRPSTFELVINLKTAKALGLTIPPAAAAAGGPGDRVMNRRAFLASFGVLGMPRAVEAQSAVSPRVIGYVGNGDARTGARNVEALKQGLRARGWTEEALRIEYRWAEGNVDRLPGLIAELLQFKVDLLFVSGPPAISAARRATSTVPIVIGAILVDPVREGFVKSLARPGANITGMASQYEEIITKQVQVLTETVPKLSRLFVLRHTSSPPITANASVAAARKLRLTVEVLSVSQVSEYEGAFRTARGAGGHAMHVLPNPTFNAHRRRTDRFGCSLPPPCNL